MGEIGFLDAALRQAALAQQTGARARPVPERPWAQAQTRELISLTHWSVAADELVRVVAPELSLESFEGRVWLGALAFVTRDHRLRGLPPLPWLAGGAQLELRTYVTDGERSGIWVLSLESSSRVLAEAAKRSHRLPARRAELTLAGGGTVRSVHAARDGFAFTARLEGEEAPARPPRPGSLAAFACERDVLYSADGGRLYRAEMRCSPWQVAEARVELDCATLLPVPPENEPRGLVASRQDVVIWSLEEIAA